MNGGDMEKKLYTSHFVYDTMRRLEGHVACMGEKCVRRSGRKFKGKRPVGRFEHSLEDNIKIDLKEIRWDGVDWVNFTQDRDQ
jgi:hypothetical protein